MAVIKGNNLPNGLVGTAGDDFIYGYDGNDTLYGGTGNDHLYGGAGDDTHVIDCTGDVVIEAAGEGTDTVWAYVSDILDANVENLYLYGTATKGTGNALANKIIGNSSNNTLSGLDGNDTMCGLEGNDTLNGGTGDENLDGGPGNDVLNGGTGSDVMAGEAGNDTFVIDSTADIVSEVSGAGTDRVNAYVSHTLDANVENLYLYGTATKGSGNTLNNVIIGNSSANFLYGLDGNDTLNGGINADHMYGGAGNDTYFVDSTNDVVHEAMGAGTDRVNSYVNDILDANVENLYLYGTAANGTGNALNNMIGGNSNANTLTGRGGNDSLYGYAGIDTLKGGVGIDILNGGDGQDRFVFGESGSTNRDRIIDFSHGDDTIVLRDILDGVVNSSLKGLSFNAGVLNEYFEGAGYTGNGAQSSGIYNDTSTGNIWYNPTSGASGDSVVICNVGVATAAPLDNTDFVYSA